MYRGAEIICGKNWDVDPPKLIKHGPPRPRDPTQLADLSLICILPQSLRKCVDSRSNKLIKRFSDSPHMIPASL